MKKYCFLFLCLLWILAVSCEEHSNTPSTGNSTPPGQITNLVVENLIGSAKISFDLPKDKDFLYVKACYTVWGEPFEQRSSAYVNHITLEGFADTEQYEVKLYSVGRHENESEPVVVTVNPLTPPHEAVMNSMQYSPDFGGVNLQFVNENKANVVVVVLAKDNEGEYSQVDAIYSKMQNVNYSVRGMEAVEQHFAIYVRDRWYHTTDTLYFSLTPVYEEQLNKSLLKDARYATEPEPYSNSWVIARMWDDNLTTGFHTKQGVGLPLSFTFDLGQTAKLSRMKTWQRTGTFLYGHGNPKKWEVWGAVERPVTNTGYGPNGFDGWIKLMDCESIKPSGAPSGTVTTEDTEYATAGEEFTFPSGTPEIRYMRWYVRESWSAGEGNPGGFFHLMELILWGSGAGSE